MVTELVVHRVVAGGNGLAEHEGLKVFVPFAAPEERVRARFVTRKRDYAVARIEEVLEPSPLRVEPRCPLFGECGGCQLQHISYEGQLVVKKLIVNDALQRIGRVFLPVGNLRPADPAWRYRNKTQYPVAGNGGIRVGFYRRGSHDLVDVPACPLHPGRFDELRRAACDAFVGAGERPYDERTHRGNIRHLVLRTNGTDDLVIVTTRTGRLAEPVAAALAAVPGVAGVVQSVNPARTNRILGSRTARLSGGDHLVHDILDRRFRVSAKSFCQVHAGQAARLCRKVLKHAAPSGDEVVLDLFSGIGMLSIILARFVDRVVGIELEPAAVRDARHNSRINDTGNVEFIEGAVADVLPGIERADIVILDPPRRGCQPETLRRIAGLRPRTVVYVSCGPATLARDLRVLAGLGYAATDIEPLDMFPQTFHVETVARLEPAA